MLDEQALRKLIEQFVLSTGYETLYSVYDQGPIDIPAIGDACKELIAKLQEIQAMVGD